MVQSSLFYDYTLSTQRAGPFSTHSPYYSPRNLQSRSSVLSLRLSLTGRPQPSSWNPWSAWDGTAYRDSLLTCILSCGRYCSTVGIHRRCHAAASTRCAAILLCQSCCPIGSSYHLHCQDLWAASSREDPLRKCIVDSACFLVLSPRPQLPRRTLRGKARRHS